MRPRLSVVVKEMRTREVRKALLRAGCVVISSDGRHEKWGCPCGKHQYPLAASHIRTSPGLIRDAIRKLECLPTGWLQ